MSDMAALAGAGGGVGGGGVWEGNETDENVGESTPGEWDGKGGRLLLRRWRFSRSLAAADLIRSFVCCEAISHRTGSFGAIRGAFLCTFGSASPSTLLFRPRVSA